MQRIIHSLKYENNFRVGEILGRMLGHKLLNDIKSPSPDLILPVPLHHLKKSERGYNQSFYISKGVNKILNLALNDKSAKRIKYTETQTSMNIKERERNIAGAFQVRSSKSIAGKNILIIDDVITSGNTVSEFGRILKKNGAGTIYAASLAIAD